MIVNIVLILTAAALLAAVWRIIKGPRHADRVVALDIFFSAGVALCALSSYAIGQTVFLDVAIGLALVGFVATVAWARVLDRSATPAPARGESPGGGGGR